MALPSSPPLLPEFDLPQSPQLLSDEAGDLPIRPSHFLIARPSLKRQFSDYESASSDPLFSEGTSEAEEEQSEERRRHKRLVRGPWFDLKRSSTLGLRRRMAKRDHIKNADSGVWLGSDMSDDGVDSTQSSQEKMADLDTEARSGPSTAWASQQCQQLSDAEVAAAKAISRCLEAGYESVDLSDLNLTTLSSDTLRPLHQLIRHSHNDLTQAPSEDEFSALTPSVQLYLSGNKLTSLPSELFRLTNITVLSLRRNDLTDIPSSISQLSNLHELNIAQNNITCLPWELLDLLHCRGTHRPIIVRPNPLVDPIRNLNGPSPLPRPKVTPGEYNEHLSRWGETSGAFFQQMRQWYSEEGVPWTMRHDLELRLKLGRLKRTMYLQEASRAGVELELCREQLVYLASSAVMFFDVNGSLCRNTNSITHVSEDDQFDAVVDPPAYHAMDLETSKCSSLFELALRSIQANFNLQDLPEDLPSTITSALQQAAKGVEYGNKKCSVCGNHFIITRAAWVEFWFNGFPAQECLTRETVLPFMRRVCSYRCVQPNELGAFRF